MKKKMLLACIKVSGVTQRGDRHPILYRKKKHGSILMGNKGVTKLVGFLVKRHGVVGGERFFFCVGTD